MKRKIKIIIKKRTPPVVRFWGGGINRIVKFTELLYKHWCLLSCSFLLILLSQKIDDALSFILEIWLAIIVLALLYELARKKWWPKNVKRDFLEDFPGNWILMSTQFLVAFFVFILSFVLGRVPKPDLVTGSVAA